MAINKHTKQYLGILHIEWYSIDQSIDLNEFAQAQQDKHKSEYDLQQKYTGTCVSLAVEAANEFEANERSYGKEITKLFERVDIFWRVELHVEWIAAGQ